jgi:hypothetical protein
MKRNDLLTNETFNAGRITQKFARAENRIKYWNKRATSHRRSISHIQKPLHNNLKILNRLMQDEVEKKFHKEYLLGCSYDFSKITNYVSIGGKELPCIYNYYIQPVGENMVLIKKLKPKND